MSIRTYDREILRRNHEVTIRREPGLPLPYLFACPWCQFRRKYKTEEGAVNGAAAHLRVHGKRLTLGKEGA